MKPPSNLFIQRIGENASAEKKFGSNFWSNDLFIYLPTKLLFFEAQDKLALYRLLSSIRCRLLFSEHHFCYSQRYTWNSLVNILQAKRFKLWAARVLHLYYVPPSSAISFVIQQKPLNNQGHQVFYQCVTCHPILYLRRE